jgi:hypothetical protein
MLRALASACLGVAMLTGVAQSAVLNVDAKANGGFGSSSGGTLGTAMVPFAVLGAATFQISVTGLINVCANCSGLPLVGPEGITFPDFPNGNGEILPLEERDAIDPDPSDFLGALIGAFVPSGTPGNDGFDEDIGGDVAAAALFLIGSGPFLFTAPGAGTLYLGINDSYVANDSGSFAVTITQVRATEVPEPATLMMLGLGVAVFRMVRRRGRCDSAAASR